VLETMKKTLPIILLMFIFITSLVVADDSLFLDDGFIPNIYISENGFSAYSSKVDDQPSANFSTYNQRVGSDERYPLMVDFGDGELMIIATDGNFITGYSHDSSSLTKVMEYNAGSSMASRPIAFVRTNDSIPLIYHNNTHFFKLNKTGATLEVINISESPQPIVSNSPIICNSEDFDAPVCFAISTSATPYSIIKYYPENETIIAMGDNNSIDFSSLSQNIVLTSLTHNGDMQLIYGSRPTATLPVRINVYDFETNTTTGAYTPTSCGNSRRDGWVGQIQVADLDGGSFEIMMGFGQVWRSTGSGNYDTNVGVYTWKSDLTAYAHQAYYAVGCTGSATKDTRVKSIFQGSVESAEDLCYSVGSATNGGVWTYRLVCKDMLTGIQTYSRTSSTDEFGYISGYDFDDDGGYELYNYKGIINTSTSSSLSYSTVFPEITSGRTTVADLIGDFDGIPEIIKLTSDNVIAMWSDVSNDPPVIDRTLEHSGYHNYYSTVCLNSTVTFRARECTDEQTDCNYENDFTNDEERIVTNCGQDSIGNPTSSYTTGIDNGTFNSEGNPFFQCVYSQTGTFGVRLYLQDDSYPNDFSQYNDIDINIHVIDGIEGETCNVGFVTLADVEDVGVSGSQAVDDDIAGLFDILLGTSSALKFVVGMAIMIGIIIMVAQYTSNAVVMIFSGILGLVIVTFLGLVPAYLLILIIIIALIGIVFSKLVFSGSE